MINGLVSVVIPTCNDGTYVKESIDSILNQTYKNLEVIVVDSSDADDETKGYLASYGDDINVYCQPRNGIAAALNYGYEQCSGEYIARMDADDVAYPERIEKEVEFLNSHPDIAFVGTEADTINKDGVIIDKVESHCYSHSEIMARLIFENAIIHPSIMMRRELVDNGWRYNEKLYSEDADLWMRMAASGVKFANIPEHLMKYRHFDGNASGQREKVAPSVAASAKIFVEKMWQISEHDAQDFTRPYYPFLVTEDATIWIKNELNLISEIWEKNEELSVIDRKPLELELNKRFKWLLCEMYGEYRVFYQELVHDISAGFVLDELAHRWEISLKDVPARIYDDVLKYDKKIQLFEKESVDIVLYGMGIRGQRILEALNKSGTSKWNIVGVVDKNLVDDSEIEYPLLSKKQLVDVECDAVVISSNRFFDEIRDELLEVGVDDAVIFPSSILKVI